jgi:hypothetical protein
VIVGSVDTPVWALGVAVVGSYAYVADRSSLQVIEITNPESPVIVGSVYTPGLALRVAVLGSYAYVAARHSGLHVIEITNPESPVIVGSVDTPNEARGVAVLGSHAYVADYGSGLQVIDIMNPESPVIVGSVDTPGAAWGVAVMGSYAYVADGSSLQVIDIMNPESPVIVGSVYTPGLAFGVAVLGSHAYVADYGSGLQVIDIMNPESPVIVGSVYTPSNAHGVAVLGSYAYVADYGSGPQVIDIMNPESPMIVGSVYTPGQTQGVAVMGSHAYVAVGSSGLTIVPAQCDDQTIAVALDIKPGSCPNPLNVKPFQDPPDPEILGSLSMSSGAARGGVLPVAVLGTIDLDVDDIDVSSLLLEGVAPLRHSYEDVAAPVEDGEECECTTAGPDGYMDLTLKFQKSEIAAALGAFSDGDVIALTLKGQLNDGTPFKGIDCVVIRARKPSPPHLSGPEEVVLHPAVPNPFNPTTTIAFSIDREAPAVLSIYDVAGRLVRTLVNRRLEAGSYTEAWDGRDASGDEVASGIYFYRLKAGRKVLTRKMVFIK